MKWRNPPRSTSPGSQSRVTTARSTGLPDASRTVTLSARTIATSPSSRWTQRRVIAITAAGSDATRFSPSPSPTTSGGPLRNATTVPGSPTAIAATAYWPRSRERTAIAAAVRSPPARASRWAITSESVSDEKRTPTRSSSRLSSRKFSMMPLWTMATRPPSSVWGWALRSTGAPCVAQRVCPSARWPRSPTVSAISPAGPRSAPRCPRSRSRGTRGGATPRGPPARPRAGPRTLRSRTYTLQTQTDPAGSRPAGPNTLIAATVRQRRDRGPVPKRDVLENGVGADPAAAADPAGAAEVHAGFQHRVAPDRARGVDPGRGGVEHRDASPLQGGDNARAQQTVDLGEVGARVDPRHLGGIRERQPNHPHPSRSQDADRVGEVVLLLGVARREPGEGGAQRE